MAEIDIERRPQRSATPWIIAVLVLVAVAVGAWILLSGDGEVERDATPAAETRGVPGGESERPPSTAPSATPDDPSATGGGDPGLEPINADPSGPDDPAPLPADTLGGARL